MNLIFDLVLIIFLCVLCGKKVFLLLTYSFIMPLVFYPS